MQLKVSTSSTWTRKKNSIWNIIEVIIHHSLFEEITSETQVKNWHYIENLPKLF